MRNNKGFTLVESLFSLTIIIILSTLSLTLFKKTNFQDTKDIERNYLQVESLLEEARCLALTNHQKIDLVLTKNSIGYQAKQKSRTLTLSKDIYFSEIKDIYFNNNGNFNQGNHIYIGNHRLRYKIIFHVGSGDFYLQQ